MRIYTTFLHSFSIRIFVWAFVWIQLLALTSSVQAVSVSRQTETLDKIINAIRLKHNVAAVAYVLVSPEKVIHTAAHGISDRKTGRPASIDTVFRIGSITKSFTSLALLKLQEQGKLSLNDKLSDHFSDAPLDNPWRQTHPVRIAHLLEHTAGLNDLTKIEFDYPGTKPLTLKQGLFITREPRKALWPPGMHSSYSNAGAGYAAYALEAVTKIKYEDYVKNELFIPLDMKHASFFLDKSTKKRLATGYDTDGDTVIPYWNMILRPFGAINTTANEMAHFVQMLLNYGLYNNRRILEKLSIERMEKPETTLAASVGLTFGYGTGNYQYIHNGFLFHGHGGDGDGYLAHYGYNRDINLGYFVVINAFNYKALSAIRNKIEDYITNEREPPEAKNPITLPMSLLKKLTGRYQTVTHRFPWATLPNNRNIKRDQFVITLKNKYLLLELPDKTSRKLLPVTKYHFRYIDEPVATIAFIHHQGELYFQGDAGNYRKIVPGM